LLLGDENCVPKFVIKITFKMRNILLG
jgi:hypothetical protein